MRADRLLALLALLQNHRNLTAGELALRLGVSVRTVHRDLDVLSASGVPVYTERGRGGGIRLLEGYASRLTGLSPGEAEAMALVSTPSVLEDVRLTRDYGLALEKLAAAIPLVHQLRAQHARHRLMLDTAPWFRTSAPSTAVQRLDQLRRAVWTDRICRLHYQRGDGTRRHYTVAGYALVAKVDVWYLVGHTAPGMRVFRVSRILELEVATDGFIRDPAFDLPRFWKAWCERFEARGFDRYRVTVQLDHTACRQLRERYGGWHAEALAGWHDQAPDNVVELDLENEDIAARVLFELGDHARLLAPSALRGHLQRRALELLESLGDTPAQAPTERSGPPGGSASAVDPTA